MEPSAAYASGPSPRKKITSPPGIKLLWAAMIGAVGWGSACYLGTDGIRMLANLAGLPGLLIVLGSAGSLVVMLVKPHRLRII